MTTYSANLRAALGTMRANLRLPVHEAAQRLKRDGGRAGGGGQGRAGQGTGKQRGAAGGLVVRWSEGLVKGGVGGLIGPQTPLLVGGGGCVRRTPARVNGEAEGAKSAALHS